ncbi:MAG: hypothetical protein HZB46_16505 [Solirubrobacterales bacterium]|nr:hypothetical protein [Solirubrobacterales bacterium]
MQFETPLRVLVVADRSAATPALLRAVQERARRAPAQFVVLVPNPAPAEWHPFHPERRDKLAEAERVLLRALPAIQDAADDAVRGRVSVRHDPMDAIEEALADEPFDEILLSVVPHGLERWLHVDLAHRLARLHLPVTAISDDQPGEA